MRPRSDSPDFPVRDTVIHTVTHPLENEAMMDHEETGESAINLSTNHTTRSASSPTPNGSVDVKNGDVQTSKPQRSKLSHSISDGSSLLSLSPSLLMMNPQLLVRQQMQQLLQQQVLSPTQIQQLLHQQQSLFLQQQQQQQQLKQLESMIPHLQEQLQLNMVQQTQILQQLNSATSGSGEKVNNRHQLQVQLQQLAVQQHQLMQQIQLGHQQYFLGLSPNDLQNFWKEGNGNQEENGAKLTGLNGLLHSPPLISNQTSTSSQAVNGQTDVSTSFNQPSSSISTLKEEVNSASSPSKHPLYGHGVCRWPGCETVCDTQQAFLTSKPQRSKLSHSISDGSSLLSLSPSLLMMNPQLLVRQQMQQLLQQQVLSPTQIQQLLHQQQSLFLQQQQQQQQLKQLESMIPHLQEQLQLNMVQQTQILQQLNSATSGSGEKVNNRHQLQVQLQQLAVQQHQLMQQIQLGHQQYFLGLSPNDLQNFWKEGNGNQEENGAKLTGLNGLLHSPPLISNQTSTSSQAVNGQTDVSTSFNQPSSSISTLKEEVNSASSPSKHPLYGHGVCRWPGCETVCDTQQAFLKHLNTEHQLDDRSTAQARVQMQVVSQLELQLSKEKERLQAMMQHLHMTQPSPSNNNSSTSKTDTRSRKINNNLFKNLFYHFSRHLNTEHQLDDRSTAQARVQMQVVSQLELQLSKEKERLQAMMQHLHMTQPSPSNNNSSTSKTDTPATSSTKVSRLSPQLSTIASSSSSPSLSAAVTTMSTSTAIVPVPRLLPQVLQPPAPSNVGPMRRRLGDKNYSPISGLDVPLLPDSPIRRRVAERSNLDINEEINRNREFYRTADVRPPFTYASLIRQAIVEAPDKQLTLNEIYNWFQNTFCYFRRNAATWKVDRVTQYCKGAVVYPESELEMATHTSFKEMGRESSVLSLSQSQETPNQVGSPPLHHNPGLYGDSLNASLQAALAENNMSFLNNTTNSSSLMSGSLLTLASTSSPNPAFIESDCLGTDMMNQNATNEKISSTEIEVKQEPLSNDPNDSDNGKSHYFTDDSQQEETKCQSSEASGDMDVAEDLSLSSSETHLAPCPRGGCL
ncbi:forkhead box protein P1-like [Centruroides sculpturatus]|uniref:forkhead box protein P1-like n=1 Tax=Centruroides sculpturatus TaxID=218467 RepID=UPI000C6D6B84|nr:forkhead box protein P1-like [Centruroides sculpturatus]